MDEVEAMVLLVNLEAVMHARFTREQKAIAIVMLTKEGKRNGTRS